MKDTKPILDDPDAAKRDLMFCRPTELSRKRGETR
jgi:hypothetical protein